MTRRSVPNPDDIVAKNWPLDRRSHEHLRTAIATSSELVRYANHVTLDNADTTLEYAGELYTVIGAVAGMIERLPQLLRQLANRAEVIATAPTLRSGRREEDPAAAMEAAAELLRKASSLAGAPMDAGREAHAKLTWVGHR